MTKPGFAGISEHEGPVISAENQKFSKIQERSSVAIKCQGYVDFSFIPWELFTMKFSHKIKQPIVFIILKFWDNRMQVLEGRDLNIATVVNECCPTTMLPFIIRELCTKRSDNNYISALSLADLTHSNFFSITKFYAHFKR